MEFDLLSTLIVQLPNLIGLLLLSASLWVQNGRAWAMLEKELEEAREFMRALLEDRTRH